MGVKRLYLPEYSKLCLRALLIQMGVKLNCCRFSNLFCLRALLIQMGVKLQTSGKVRKDSLRALLIQMGVKLEPVAVLYNFV